MSEVPSQPQIEANARESSRPLADTGAGRWKHVSYLWDERDAPTDPVDLLLYRSKLLGADRRITNYGGGNTSVKVPGLNPITADRIQVLWIKGSGGDLATLERSGLAALDNELVTGLEKGYRGPAHEDDQARLVLGCALDPSGPAPSIDTAVHALIPRAHVDHVHPDSVIAFATAVEGQRLVKEVFGDEVGWLDWQRPGFGLAIRLRDMYQKNRQMRAIVLGAHGLVVWGDTAKECYESTLTIIERAGEAITSRATSLPGSPFGKRFVSVLTTEERQQQAAMAMPILRAQTSSAHRMIGHFQDADPVLEFVCSVDAKRLVQLGTSCPDHFLRTKQRPLLLEIPATATPGDFADKASAAIASYRTDYSTYYAENAGSDSPEMRSPTPAVVLWPGVGMFTLAANKREARIASEFYSNAINVMRGAETLSKYQGLPENEAFRVEYWDLEEAKLRRMPARKPLAGRVALVTGGVLQSPEGSWLKALVW